MTNESHTTPSDRTRQAEQKEAQSPHDADRPPTRDEEHDAERAGKPSEETARSYKEMAERGAKDKGEGRLP